MKWFIDTEFSERGPKHPIELISVALVSEKEHAIYLVSNEFDESGCNEFVKEHVLPKLDGKRFSLENIKKNIRTFIEFHEHAEHGRCAPEFWGYYCVAPETRVLRADLRWVPIGSLEAGDVLMGFEERGRSGVGRSSRPRCWKPSLVEFVETIERPCCDLFFEDGTRVRCTYDHRWLVGGYEGAQWRTTKSLVVGSSRVVKPVDVWSTENGYDSGYLAAAFDGEGHLVQKDLSDCERGVYRFRVGFAQKHNPMLSTVQAMLARNGYRTSVSGNKKTSVAHVFIGNRGEVLRFLGSTRPARLLSKFDPNKVGAITHRTVRLVDKVDVGLGDVVSIKTSTRTYVAEGLASHNCDYDWVIFCQIFGRMVDLPNGWPQFCHDVRQLMDEYEISKAQLPLVDKNAAHDALYDARWTREAYLCCRQLADAKIDAQINDALYAQAASFAEGE